MKRAVIIVAGGKGIRMGLNTPKQFLELSGIPILCRTIQQFKNFDPTIDIILALPPQYIDFWKRISQSALPENSYKICKGGQERFHSVKNAISLLSSDIDIVGVHDGVRPLVSVSCIARCYTEAALNGNAVPCIKPPESIRTIDQNGNNHTLDRNIVKLIQTPQVFHADILQKAYNQPYNPIFTDDATVVESFGEKINLIDGESTNIKITTFDDLTYAEYIVSKMQKNP